MSFDVRVPLCREVACTCVLRVQLPAFVCPSSSSLLLFLSPSFSFVLLFTSHNSLTLSLSFCPARSEDLCGANPLPHLVPISGKLFSSSSSSSIFFLHLLSLRFLCFLSLLPSFPIDRLSIEKGGSEGVCIGRVLGDFRAI